MPYGLWEDLHQQVVRMDYAQFLKTNHPMLHVFYKSMGAQLCAVTRCRLEMHRKTLAVPKFFGYYMQWGLQLLEFTCIFVFVHCVPDSNFIKGRVAHILVAFVVVLD